MTAEDPPVGEDLHEIGKDGAIRAKRWLDATTRVKASWLNTDKGAAKKVKFFWPVTRRSFSFDLGGILRGEEFENQMFLAECKKYTRIGKQPAAYRQYLAKCYVARMSSPVHTDHFMWITWHPFLVESWRDLCGEEEICSAVINERARIFRAEATVDEAKEMVDPALCKDLASRLWLLVLSDRQERLVITDKHRSLIIGHDIERGAW